MDDGDDIDADVWDAKNTKCPKCGVEYQVVRPGKIQPSCSCEYVDALRAERDALQQRNDELGLECGLAHRRAAEALYTRINLLGELERAKVERDAVINGKADGYEAMLVAIRGIVAARDIAVARADRAEALHKVVLEGDWGRARAREAEADRLRAALTDRDDLLRSLRQDIQHHNCMSETCDACDIDRVLSSTPAAAGSSVSSMERQSPECAMDSALTNVAGGAATDDLRGDGLSINNTVDPARLARIVAAAQTPGPVLVKAPNAPQFDLVAHLYRQRDFNERTFGPGRRTTALLDHIRKELVEIEADPADLSEWIDVVILACDGAMRRGYTPEQFATALAAKQIENEARTWPDWRTVPEGKPIEHDRSGEAQP